MLGIQFHFEMNKGSIVEMIQNGKEELVNGPYIMKECNMIHGIEHYGEKKSNLMLNKLLDRIAQKHFHF